MFYIKVYQKYLMLKQTHTCTISNTLVSKEGKRTKKAEGTVFAP